MLPHNGFLLSTQETGVGGTTLCELSSVICHLIHLDADKLFLFNTVE